VRSNIVSPLGLEIDVAVQCVALSIAALIQDFCKILWPWSVAPTWRARGREHVPYLDLNSQRKSFSAALWTIEFPKSWDCYRTEVHCRVAEFARLAAQKASLAATI